MQRFGIILLTAAVVISGRFASAQDSRLPVGHDEPDASSSYLSVDGDRVVDSVGRQVLLHGLNIVSKSKNTNYRIWQKANDFEVMRRWGMNCIRLGIIWDGLQPQPGKYDEAYLDRIEQYVGWAERCGLYVFLDMHQDLFSVHYSDGAPEWATLHEDKAHVEGAVWSDAYLVSPAVQTAFDNFWANAPAPDGTGIQDHYAAAWRHVAKRFANNPTVIGYDLMNEPFEGSSVSASQAALLQSRFADLMIERLGGQVQSPAELAKMWLHPEGRAKVMAQLEDRAIYKAFVDAQAKHSQQFERKHLQPMYQRVANAIRSVDRNHILFLETNYHCNMGVLSGIEPVTTTDGQRDSLLVYAPHGYDLTVDTAAQVHAGTQRVELIFTRHGQTASRLKMPLLIGEWGAFGNLGKQVVPQARTIQRLFERLRCGDTYWDYQREIDKQAYFGSLRRSIPVRIAGTLIAYDSDPDSREFMCRWREQPDVTASTIVYLTADVLKGKRIQLDPSPADYELQPVPDNSGNVYLSIPALGQARVRTVTVR